MTEKMFHISENSGIGVFMPRPSPSAIPGLEGDVVFAIKTRWFERVELRVTPSLWKLADQVKESSLGFSIIRMRNAQPK